MHRRNATRLLRPLTILTVVLILGGMMLTPAAIVAQELGTPVAANGGSTDTPVADQGGDWSGDPTATATAVTGDGGSAPQEISDRIAPVDGPLSVTAGETAAVPLDYLVSTIRAGTVIHVELRFPNGSVASGWNLRVNDISGAGRVDLADPLTDAGTATLAIRAAAPAEAESGQIVEVHVSWLVDLGDGNGAVVAALDGTAALATIVVAAIQNKGPAIATAWVNLHVSRDGTEIEVYPLADKQAIGQGETTITQRYIPVDDWKPGSYMFAGEIIAIDAQNGAETSIGVVKSADTVEVK